MLAEQGQLLLLGLSRVPSRATPPEGGYWRERQIWFQSLPPIHLTSASRSFPASNFSHSTSSSHPPLPVFFPKFPSEAEQVSTGMGGAGAAAWSLGAAHDKAQVWGRSEQILAFTEPLNLFLWGSPRKASGISCCQVCQKLWGSSF